MCVTLCLEEVFYKQGVSGRSLGTATNEDAHLIWWSRLGRQSVYLLQCWTLPVDPNSFRLFQAESGKSWLLRKILVSDLAVWRYRTWLKSSCSELHGYMYLRKRAGPFYAKSAIIYPLYIKALGLQPSVSRGWNLWMCVFRFFLGGRYIRL